MPKLGAVGAHGFLIDMNRLYETFVFCRLRQFFLGTDWELTGQQTRALDVQRNILMNPDIELCDSGGRRVIADTKYKTYQKPSAADVYQMVAYCRGMRARRAVLIPVGDYPPYRLEINDKTTIVEVCPVKLDGNEAEMNESIQTLVELLVRSEN